MVEDSVLSFNQCFDTVGCETGIVAALQHTVKKYPYVHRYLVASFPYFNGTSSVYVCIR